MKLSFTNLPTVFEISDIKFPDELDLKDPENVWHQHFVGVHPDTGEECIRESAQQLNLVLDEFYKNFLKELGKLLKDKIAEQFTKDIVTWWPESFIQEYIFEEQQINIFRDSPNFNMGLHVDNGLSLGTCVINVTDSNSYTEYYESDSDEVVAYRGPSKKGTGIVHINQPGLWHSGINNGPDERYIMMSYFSVI